MATIKKGTRVSWNSEGGRVIGKILEIITKDFTRAGKDGRKYVHKASKEEHYYKLESEKTGYISYHKKGSLRILKNK